MNLDIMTAVMAAVSPVVIGVIVWGFRLESRVDRNEVLFKTREEGLKELINSRFDAQTQRFENVDERLGRIERALNGAWERANH